jgi:hypothetical protein
MITAILAIHDGRQENIVNLDEEQIEWILNSLRLMQEAQQASATKHAGEEMTKQDVVDALNTGGDLGKSRDWKVPEGSEEEKVNMGEFFLEQFQAVTDLREAIVQATGRDLTEG